jgi:cytochrome oxidase Cu insertion factor (SCO1/SenC/PrrC family)
MQRLLLLAVGAFALSVGVLAQGMKKPLAVGDTAPAFSLPDQNGKQVSFAPCQESKPVVLVFYRGYW